MLTDTTRTHVDDWLIGYPLASRAGYRRDIEALAEFLEDTDLLDATRPKIQRWLAHLSETRRLAASTVRRKASAVSSFYTWCVAGKILEHNPADQLRRPRGEGAPRRGLELADARRLITTAENHSTLAAALVWLMAGAGLRVTEACSARIEHLDGHRLTVTVKGGHRQTKPLSAPVLAAVTKTIGDRQAGTILTNSNRQPLSRRPLSLEARRLSIDTRHVGPGSPRRIDA